ncbi:MAG: selenocysteine-specific translation elongation factor [Candidatus Eisenbacteria bacterium]|nr:selenocysteine-specific translation elongation factor [Candidatus Eisenbacteria bacterium]
MPPTAERTDPALRHRPLIMGTAGHIDHGKTALIKLLTGVDTDRLKEEQERGITIELGFASLRLPSGEMLGIVDVPGHERFVRNMLAGAGGIDLILFVIAADEGVMPQTREHMDIIDLLGVEHGVVALTKIDLVEPDFLELVEETVREYLQESCLKNAPIVPVSSTKGTGREALLAAIEEVAAQVRVRERGHLPRLPIDRVFTMEGFGTVVTGTLWAGTLHEGDSVRIVPGEITSRIRSLEVHNARVPEARAGQRTAVLLHAVEKSAIERGNWLLAGDEGEVSPLVDVRLRALRSAAKPIENGQRIRFHLGAAETLGRLFLLEKEALRPGEEGLAQIRLEAPVLAERNDRFVIRSYSPMLTIAGGSVVTAGVGRRRRHRREDIDALVQAERGTPLERIAAVLERHGAAGAERETLARESGCTLPETESAIQALVEQGQARAVGRKAFVSATALADAGAKLADILRAYQRQAPLSWGLMKSELKKRVEGAIHPDAVEAWVQQEAEAGRVFVRNDRLREGTDKLNLSPAYEALHRAILAEIEEAGFAGRRQVEVLAAMGGQPGAAGAAPRGHAPTGGRPGVSPSESKPASGARKTDAREVEALLTLLVDSGEIVRVPPEFYFTRARLEELAEKVRRFFADHAEMNVGDLKDLIGVSRKQAVPLLEYLDLARVTLRRGDVRVKGPKLSGG